MALTSMAPADKIRGGEPANLILRKTRLEGDLHFPSQLVVAGQVKGNIRCDSALIIECGGRIEGRIEAPVIIVHGELDGTVLASQSIEIWSGAIVGGDIAARSVRVDEGARLTANLLIAADLPDRLGPPATQSPDALEATEGRARDAKLPNAPDVTPGAETRPSKSILQPESFLSSSLATDHG